MTLRSRLLTMTLSMSSGALPVNGLPVAASMSLSSLVWMKTFFCSALYISRASLQRLQQRLGERIAAGDDLVDGLAGGVQRAFGEAGERVFIGAGMGRGAGQEQDKSEYERQHAVMKQRMAVNPRHRRCAWEAATAAASPVVVSQRSAQEPCPPHFLVTVL